MQYKNNPNYKPVIVKRGNGQTIVYKRIQQLSPLKIHEEPVFFDIADSEALQFANEIANKFADKDIPIYLVGGGVRDHLNGSVIDDFDFATPVMPDKVKAAAEVVGSVWELGGEEHGTIALNYGDEKIEITTFRTETYDGDRKNPNVSFIEDIKGDLSRRDFTINAMAINPQTGELIDPFNGRSALENKILETPGLAYDRFFEDPLRVDRAIRFCARDGYEMSDEVYAAAQQIVAEGKLRELSRERHTNELEKINKAGGQALGDSMLLADELGAFEDMFSEGVEYVEGLSNLVRELDNPDNRLIAILLAGGDAEKMKLQNKYRDTATKVRNAKELIAKEYADGSTSSVSYTLALYYNGEDAIDYLADEGNPAARWALDNKDKFQKNSPSMVKGGTITQLGSGKGLKPGPWISDIKTKADEAFIRSEGTMSEDDLLVYVNDMLSSL